MTGLSGHCWLLSLAEPEKEASKGHGMGEGLK